MSRVSGNIFVFLIYTILGCVVMLTAEPVKALANQSGPKKVTKLVFIHHSVGGYWLAHDNGGLVSELNKNNYYVNDITYGWEPDELTNTITKKIKRNVLDKLGKANKGAYGIGNRTDIGHMPEWFIGKDSELIISSLYRENRETEQYGDHKNSTSSDPLANPGAALENQIVMFKSCYPNSMLSGNPDDPPAQESPPIFGAGTQHHTVANAKRVFNDLLTYFSNQPDKFFVIVTPPPRSELPENGVIARGFCNWLVHSWLKENQYPLNNVMVFDLFNVLTSGHDSKQGDAGDEQGNHHRIWKGEVQHIVQTNNNLLVYPSKEGDDHPSPVGLQKAAQEFVPLLNYYYVSWHNSL